ncbi:DUF962 domain-containing protein [Myxococcota bacterium]|nr:DUF962 domain-containing protein [Myxococcota bacterium]
MPKPRLQALFDAYAADHQHPMNRATHKLGVPLVLFHILAMLGWIELLAVPGLPFPLTAAHLLGLCVLPWYLSLDVKLAAIVSAVSILFMAVSPWVPVWAVLAITALAWALQLVGHYVYEKRSPSFFSNLLQLLVGPLFIAAVLTGDWKPAAAR